METLSAWRPPGANDSDIGGSIFYNFSPSVMTEIQHCLVQLSDDKLQLSDDPWYHGFDMSLP